MLSRAKNTTNTIKILLYTSCTRNTTSVDIDVKSNAEFCANFTQPDTQIHHIISLLVVWRGSQLFDTSDLLLPARRQSQQRHSLFNAKSSSTSMPC